MKIPWKEFVYYDESSVTGLRWRVSRRGGVKEHDVAGSINKGRCSFIFSYAGTKKRRYTHRVIWELFYGEICKDKEIDHIDGNPLNNSIGNLRLVTAKINKRNCKMNSRNTSGCAGVSFVTVNGYDYYVVTYVDNNSNHKVKYFSCLKLGHDLAKESAIAYREYQLKLIGGYSERHGK